MESELELSRGMKVAIAGVVGMFMCMFFAMLVVIGVLGYMVYRGQQAPAPAPQPAPVFVTSAITTMLDPHDELAAKLAALHTEMANIIEQDTTVIKTTGDIRQANSVAGRLCMENATKGTVPGLAAALDQVLVDAIGKQSKVLTAEDRADAVKAFRAIAAAEAKAAE